MALTRTPTPRGLAAAVQAGPSGFGPDFDEQFAAAVFADPALILGETGCGKEVVARALHAAGFSRTGPFVAVNCATLDKGLAPAALFGHVKGAFTGAVAPAAGLVAQAEGGTLFLDEIGELDRYVQAMLLRLLENRTVRAVGGARERQIRVRVLAATHTDLDAAIRVGEFRADLYHRLAAEVVQLTPLRDRISQLPVLCELLMPGIDAELAGKLPDYSPAGGGTCSEILALLAAHDWPGNVRELRHVLHRARRLAHGGEIRAEHMRFQAIGVRGEPPVANCHPRGPEQANLRRGPLQPGEVDLALADADNVVAVAARRLGVHRQSLSRWLNARRHSHERG